MPPRARLDQDVKPLSEFRANVSTLVQQVRRTKRPLVLTQRGRSAAVLLDVDAYESMMDELALLRDVRTAEEQITAGKGLSHVAVAKKLRARLTR